MKWSLVYFDDDIRNIESYQLMLRDYFQVHGCQDATQYLEVLKSNFPHALLIDVHMPSIDGFSLYKNIISSQSYNGCPIFFVSGDESDQNKINSLKEGGVDFFTRNIPEQEMVLRLTNKIKLFLKKTTVIELGNLKLDVEHFKVLLNQTPVELTLIEMRMLSVILRSFPQAITKKQMLSSIWGEELVKPGTINTHLTNLRTKIEGWNYSIKVKEENIYVQQS